MGRYLEMGIKYMPECEKYSAFASIIYQPNAMHWLYRMSVGGPAVQGVPP